MASCVECIPALAIHGSGACRALAGERNVAVACLTEVVITNRWSSRLRGRLEARVQSRKEPRPLAVVGGAAQLYVMRFQMRATHDIGTYPQGFPAWFSP